MSAVECYTKMHCLESKLILSILKITADIDVRLLILNVYTKCVMFQRLFVLMLS